MSDCELISSIEERNHELLREKGWDVIVVWECELEKPPIEIFKKVKQQLN